MVLNDFSDVSSVSGGPIIMGDYTASVFQHDSSGFYNWQQDNLPVIDLQERDTFLFKMLGAPTSAVEGMTFVVSSQAGPIGTNIFADMADVVARIPKRLTFPVLVELCSYASLSALDLNGITTEGAGALRIVNRNAAATKDVSITTVASTEGFYNNVTKKTPNTINSATQWDTIVNASSHSTSTTCFVEDDWKKYKKGYVAKGADQSESSANDFIHLDIEDFDHTGTKSSTPFLTTNALVESPYGNTFDFSISGYDPHPRTRSGRGDDLHHATDDPTPGVSIRKSIETGKASTTHFAMLYGSSFDSVTITNCSGKIQLENILVDGASGTGATLEHVTNHGFHIRNSDIELKNCTSIRNNVTGFNIENSDVKILESFLAARNYNIVAGGLGRSHDTGGDGILNADNAGGSASIGVKAVNSHLHFEVNSTLTFPGTYTKAAFGNGIGWELINSSITGGRTSAAGNYAGRSLCHLTALYNNYDGFILDNSKLDFIGGIDSSKNGQNGISAHNSKIRSHVYAIEDNQRSGIMATGSHILYGSQFERIVNSVDTLERGQFSFTNNGQNLTLLSNSSFKPDLNLLAQNYRLGAGVTLEDHFGNWTSSSTHHGNSVEYTPATSSVDNYKLKYHWLTGNIPGILISQNSNAEILNLNYMTPNIGGDAAGPDGGEPDEAAWMGIYGHAVLAEGNSQAILRGLNSTTSQCTTITSDFYGTLTAAFNTAADNHHLQALWSKSAVCAKGNSRIRISGPTKISRLGIALHAEDNSMIETLPPTYPFGDGSLIDSTFFNTSGSHTQTKLELHATRACIVVNNKSSWKAEYLGTKLDPNNESMNLSYDHWYNYSDDTCVSAGYIKFYPQPFSTTYSNAGASVSSLFLQTGADAGTFGIDENEDFDKSLGGMCVRAVGDSSVSVKECNFKPTAASHTTSGYIYDIQGATCMRPHIWNICDTSRLEAMRLTLSGIDPITDPDGEVSAYHGPSGTWNVTAVTAAATGQLFLDDFGSNGRMASGTEAYTDYGAFNYGYFRLMMGTKGVVEHLQVSAITGASGEAPQLLSQGYSPSSTHGSFLGGADNNYLVSSTVLNDAHSDYLDTGYAGGVLTTAQSYKWLPAYVADTFLNPHGGTRNYIDRTAMRLFANAAHLSQPHLDQLSVISPGNYDSSDEQERTADSGGAGVRSLMRFDLKRLT